MVEDKKDRSDVWMVRLAVLLIFLTVCVGLYAYLSEPFRVADRLHDRLDALMVGGVSDEYRQGWLDCVSYYLNQIYGPSNMTSSKIMGG